MQLKPNFCVSKVEFTSTKRQYVRKIIICFNKRPNIAKFNINCSCFDQSNRLYRFKSNLTIPKINKIEYRPNSLALEHINSCNPTTSEVINSMLLNQKVSISQKELDALLSLPRLGRFQPQASGSSVNFYLPITDQTYPSLLGLIGKPGSSSGPSGQRSLGKT